MPPHIAALVEPSLEEDMCTLASPLRLIVTDSAFLAILTGHLTAEATSSVFIDPSSKIPKNPNYVARSSKDNRYSSAKRIIPPPLSDIRHRLPAYC